MGPLRRMFGHGLRVKLLEALLEMGTEEFTRGELADRHGLARRNVNRVFDDLVREGFVEEVSGGGRPLYRVRDRSLRFHLLSQFESALSLAERARLGDATSEAGRRFADTVGADMTGTVRRTSGRTTPLTGDARRGRRRRRRR